jgi:hypothetical protein
MVSTCAAPSASRCDGALEFCAAWTSLTIWASAVSAPTLVARKRNVPILLIVAPMTASPTPFLTADHHDVARDNLGGRNLDRQTLAYHRRFRRREAEKRLNGFRCSGPSAHLQPVPEQNEDEQHGDRFVEDFGREEEGGTDAEEIARQHGE